MANVIKQKMPRENIVVNVDSNTVVLKCEDEYRFASSKGLKKQVRISSAGDIGVSD
jgi:hypothetical protein